MLTNTTSFSSTALHPYAKDRHLSPTERAIKRSLELLGDVRSKILTAYYLNGPPNKEKLKTLSTKYGVENVEYVVEEVRILRKAFSINLNEILKLYKSLIN